MDPTDGTKPRAPSRTATRVALSARLTVVHPATARQTIALGADPVVIGRVAAEGVVAVADSTLSSRHLEIAWNGECHVCSDLDSMNGSAIDGAADGESLRDGSLVRMGDVLAVYECWRGDLARDDRVSREAIFGDSIQLAALRARIARAAVDLAPVLITGETGVGKENVAAELHRLSGRNGPYLKINCAALSAHLVESQLFGHEKGAFSGATAAQAGILREAAGGTVLLDEIGDLPLDLQPKLLRALQESEVLPVGSARPVRVDVRVIAATHKDLSRAVETGAFRRDLFARLAMWELRVPPLRDRRIDLLAWIDRLDARFAPGAAPFSFSCEAAHELLLLDWPDNLRGLDRLIHVIAAHPRDQPIELDHLPPFAHRPPPQVEPGVAPPTPTREQFLAAHHELGGKVSELARHFGRDRKQIYRWLEAYGLRK